ncbi:MAG: peptidylprolyl isomerase [Candidatus Omnitrophica bacterium]|nr:peptidylprolyl isomerase [Candidatus Omnitrophota bacterium]
MKSVKKAVNCALFIFFMTASCLSFGDVIDKIAIVVNNEVITQREIDSMLQPVYEQYRTIYYGDELIKKLEDARKRIVNQLIEDKLIFSEAKKLNMEIGEKEIDAKVQETIERVGGNRQFEALLREQNITLKSLKTRYAEQLMVRRLVDQKVGSTIVVSPLEISEYYEKHKSEFIQPHEVKLSNILVRPKPGAEPAEALKLARDIHQRLRDGCDFAGLAKEYSEGPNGSGGGSMGYVKKGDLMPEIEETVFKLKEGEISPVIQTSVGYHIFKVDQRKDRAFRQLSEVRHEVENALFREKVKEKLKGWLENLRKNAYIAFK